jgi:hypothetical protein
MGTTDCATWVSAWSSAIVSSVVAQGTGNFTATAFGMECQAVVCALTRRLAGSYCWNEVGGLSYTVPCSGFSVFGTTVANATTTSGSGATTSATTARSSAVQTTAALAVVAAIAALATL